MNATRATMTTTDGAVFGLTTETPPEDPPPRVRRKFDPDTLARLIAHILIGLVHVLAAIAHHVNH
jgi:hypothetical protein